MPDIDIAPLRAQLGRKIVDEEVATEAPLRGMTVTFDRDEPPPPGWHLAYFPEATRRHDLGEDGLPLERGALPRMP